jgi:hypothetical protein
MGVYDKGGHMGLFRALANAIYKEYDRRIKRASLVTEYGVSHHNHSDHEDHAADTHGDEEAAEIVNVPRGTPLAAPAPVDLSQPHDYSQGQSS